MEFPESLQVLDSYTFALCGKLERMEIPGGVQTPESEVFAWCSSLPSVSLPRSVEGIRKEMLRGCARLRAVRVPSGVHGSLGRGPSPGALLWAVCADSSWMRTSTKPPLRAAPEHSLWPHGSPEAWRAGKMTSALPLTFRIYTRQSEEKPAEKLWFLAKIAKIRPEKGQNLSILPA